MKLSKTHTKIPTLFFIIFALIITVLVTAISSLSKTTLEDFSSRIIKKCQNSKYPDNCFSSEIPQLMQAPNSLTMEEAFQINRMIQREGKNNFCHVLGHKLASIETKKDPSKWKEVISRCPEGTCSGGCLHGAFQEKFRTEFLSADQIEASKPELLEICRKRPEWQPSGIEQASCYHALGHLTMYLTNGDIQNSLTLCKELATNEDGLEFTRICYDGIFMQVFQPLEPEDFSLIKGISPRKDNVKEFCQQFPQESFVSCWGESWPLFRQEVADSSGAIIFCSNLSEPDQSRCLNNIFYLAPVQLKFDHPEIINYCKSFPKNFRGSCFSQAVLRFVQSEAGLMDEAISLCNQTLQFDPSEMCFEILAKRAIYNFNNSDLDKMCQKLPQKWHSVCYNHYK